MKMSNNGEKSSAPNGVSADPQQRLPAFKPPRDLTLGGVKPNKKVFTPNLNVARNKNKGPNLNAARDQKRDDKNKRDRKNDRNRNIKNGPNVIKSSGVFSEGLGAAERQSSRFSYGNREGGGAAAATLQKPTIRVKDFVKIDKELEEQKIRGVLGHDAPDECEDFKRLAEKDAPIALPMDTGAWDRPKPTKVKQEVVVKAEPGEDTDCTITTAPPATIKKEVFEDNDVVNLLKTNEPTLILLQLPDSLPGRGAEPEPSASASASASADGKDDAPASDGKCRLSDLEEGRIGRLRVHASGRVTLALGDTIFEVSAGTKAAFHQEAVSVAAEDASRSANLISLGPLQHKLNLTPDWENMFHDMPV